MPRLAAGTPPPCAGPCSDGSPHRHRHTRPARSRFGPGPAPFPPRAPRRTPTRHRRGPSARSLPAPLNTRPGSRPAACPRRPALTGEAAVAPPTPLPPSLPRAAVEKLRCRPLPAPRWRNGRFNLPRRPRRCPMMRPLPAPCRPRPLASTASHHSSPHARARPLRSRLPSPPLQHRWFVPSAAPARAPAARTIARVGEK